MQERVLNIKIDVDGPFCNSKNKRCRYMKETSFCGQSCEIFHKLLKKDTVLKQYRRTDECIDNEVFEKRQLVCQEPTAYHNVPTETAYSTKENDCKEW